SLKFNLENGGMLLADACCGGRVVDGGVRGLVEGMFGGKGELGALPGSDEPFGSELDGGGVPPRRRPALLAAAAAGGPPPPAQAPPPRPGGGKTKGPPGAPSPAPPTSAAPWRTRLDRLPRTAWATTRSAPGSSPAPWCCTP